MGYAVLPIEVVRVVEPHPVVPPEVVLVTVTLTLYALLTPREPPTTNVAVPLLPSCAVDDELGVVVDDGPTEHDHVTGAAVAALHEHVTLAYVPSSLRVPFDVQRAADLMVSDGFASAATDTFAVAVSFR